MSKLAVKILNIASLIILFVSNILAQMPTRPAPEVVEQDSSTLYYVVLLLLVVGLIGTIGWYLKTKRAAKEPKDDTNKDKWDSDAVDADKEMEWMRKHSKTIGRKESKTKKFSKNLPKTSKVLNKNKVESLQGSVSDADFNETKKKLARIKFNKLPINAFTNVVPAKDFDALPLSNDDMLMSAIEQTQDEFEEDEQVRELSIRILDKFKTRNSVEALTQVALYDISARLRSKAIVSLAKFDHESVFETILLGCADPTREVRAASAKALFQLSFNRADAWSRIVESNDDYRIIQSARAAIESDLVARSIDRLVHEDYKYSYEAFTLLALLVKADETKEIFQVLESHHNVEVKLAVLRVLQILKDNRVLPQVYSYMERNSLPEDLSNAANEVIKTCDLVPA